jgi:AcrR family transcriptional regulator
MARPHATEEQRERVQSRIRSAAAEIYRKEGIAGISARRIAADAGVSVGVIYAHFGDLTTLMQSLWKGKVEQQNARLREIAAKHEDPSERIGALLGEYLKFGLKNRDLYRNAFLFVRPEADAKPVAEALASYEFGALLTEAIRQGQADGRLVEAPPEHLAQALWAGVHGCLALPVNLDRVAFAPAQNMAELMAEILLSGIRTQQDLRPSTAQPSQSVRRRTSPLSPRTKGA